MSNSWVKVPAAPNTPIRIGRSPTICSSRSWPFACLNSTSVNCFVRIAMEHMCCDAELGLDLAREDFRRREATAGVNEKLALLNAVESAWDRLYKSRRSVE